MKFEILYDNEAENGFKSGWGFSCLINRRVLFDTGADLETLLFNMQKMNIDAGTIEKIVLSHEHGDHTGGIEIIRECGNIEVFVPRSFSKSFKKKLMSYSNVKLREVKNAMRVHDNILTTGELGWITKEQSLIVKADKGLILVTGCAHPGLDKIMRIASRFGEIYGIIGGFHGFSRLEALKETHLVVPCHCTQRKKEIHKLYPSTAKKCAAGQLIKT